jgi:hypothetical protein
MISDLLRTITRSIVSKNGDIKKIKSSKEIAKNC